MTTITTRTTAAAATEHLQVFDVHKEYPTPAEPLVVLRGVTLNMSSGQTLAILGPSGSGKSTLLNILGTLDRPTRGAVRLGETDPFTLSASELAAFRAKRIGFIFQEHHLLPQCTALENVLLARLAVGRVDPEHVERADGLLERVGIANRRTHFPGELSGGERQRVAIARALMNHPALLLCDEPTGNLDAKTSQTVADLLLRIARSEQTILVAVTHSAAFSGVFDKRMRMDEGRLVDA